MTHKICEIETLYQNSDVFGELNINLWASPNSKCIEFSYHGVFYNRYSKLLPEAIRANIDLKSLETRHGNTNDFIAIWVKYNYDSIQKLDQSLKELATYLKISL